MTGRQSAGVGGSHGSCRLRFAAGGAVDIGPFRCRLVPFGLDQDTQLGVIHVMQFPAAHPPAQLDAVGGGRVGVIQDEVGFQVQKTAAGHPDQPIQSSAADRVPATAVAIRWCLPPEFRRDYGLTRYRASALISFQFNKRDIRRLVTAAEPERRAA